ncbi:MAG: MMPL family transporter [Polyangiaceae bacterium]|nr:MMPL family transporter [Polyangiaceae bacterium]
MSIVAQEQAADRWLRRVTNCALNKPWRILILGGVLLLVLGGLASRLRVNGNFVMLLPSKSEAAQRFTKTVDRKGGAGSSLIVLVTSPDANSNQRFIDDLERRISALKLSSIQSMEHGPLEVRAFYQKWRWLFAPLADLTRLECEVTQEVGRQSPGYLGLDEPCESVSKSNGEKSADLPPGEGSALTRLRRKFEQEAAKADPFPTNYYRTPDGRTYALLIRSRAGGMGEFSTDSLFLKVQELAQALPKSAYHRESQYGFGGDIPNAIAERDALVDDMTIVSTVAIVLILGAIVIFFRSPFVLSHIGLAVAIGCSTAFATAYVAFGHLNAATSFLVAIIAGNGINPAIMYLARFVELKPSHGFAPAVLQAAVDTRRGTWLAALAAAGAYGALMVTNFRGFSEFGLIGAVGMLACWSATFVFCPASLAAGESIRQRFSLRRAEAHRQSTGRMEHFVANLTGRYPGWVMLVGVAITLGLAWPIPGYLANPWEYNFARLKSRSSSDRGAGYWSVKSGQVFASRGSDQLLLADSMEEAPLLAERVLARDKQLFHGRYVEKVQTIYDQLGGSPEVVQQKLELLASIREALDSAMGKLKGEDLKFANDWRPPEYLRALAPNDLPPLLLERFRETNGKIGTPVYVTLARDVSQSRGENLLAISDVLEGVKLKSGEVVPNASRASIFAEMIRSMGRDGPKATLLALLLVSILTIGVTRSLWGSAAVLGSLIAAVVWMVGFAAYADIRLNFLNFVALPLTFGIGVEYAINLFERVRAEGGDVGKGIRSAAGPVALCSLTTILGYASLLKADNQALQSFGHYAIIGEFACILSAALLMPAGLVLAKRLRK